MKVIYGINKITKFKKPVVALGVFDGVHRGHRQILKAVVDRARGIRGTGIVVTFWPHPQKEGSIYSLEHRLRLIAAVGIDICIVIKFNRRFSRIPAENFIRNILANKIGARYIYVGRNFRFGQEARGDFRLLEKLSRIYNFKAKAFDIIKINSLPISSTYIRKLITNGKLAAAEKLLSRPVSVLGTVIRGDSLASRLGFPTANIDPHHEILPPSGIYVILAIFNQKKFKGVCYIGTKPTFKTQSAKRKAHSAKHVEVHIFNFKKNIYGEYLEIQFVKKIRNDKKFSSQESLACQIKKDIVIAKHTFFLPT